MKRAFFVLAVVLTAAGYAQRPAREAPGMASEAAASAAAPAAAAVPANAIGAQAEAALRSPTGEVSDLLQDKTKLARRIELAQQAVKELGDCLRTENLCGERPVPGLAYFDPDNTPSHQALNHALRFLQAVTESSMASAVKLSDETWIRNLEIPNRETQIVSLEILLEHPLNEDVLEQVLRHSSDVADGTKPLFFELLQSAAGDSPQLRERLWSALDQSLENDEPNTVYELARNIGHLQLNEAEFRSAVRHVCHVKADPGVGDNWHAILPYLRDYAHQRNYAVNPETECG